MKRDKSVPEELIPKSKKSSEESSAGDPKSKKGSGVVVRTLFGELSANFRPFLLS